MNSISYEQQQRHLENDEISLLECWSLLRRHWRLIAAVVGAATVIAIVWSLFLPKTYKAEATIATVSSGGGALSGLAGQFGGLASLAGVSIGGGGESAKLIAILKSRSLAENVIRQENLMPILFASQWDAEGKKWHALVK